MSVPSRSEPLFWVTEYVTVPGPVPLAPVSTVIHETFETAVHGHPAGAVTVTGLVLLPFLWIVALVGLMAYVQPVACVTVKIWPEMPIVPIRSGPVFAATVKVTVPSPVPLAPVLMVIQDDAIGEAVQVQPGSTVTAMAGPGPPAAGAAKLVGLIDTMQAAA